jgi:glycosyltransferase involved in cell wall biosynthesis
MHQHYLKIARLFKNCNKITVTLQDTKYERSLRQHIIRLFSKFLYHRYFNVFWGAGDPQYAFALSIGYSAENIFTGIYTANDKVFAKPQSSYEKKRSSDRNILFVGRLAKEKNILKLASVLEEINKEYNSKHKLYIYGDGSLGPALSAFSCVEITPFSNSKSIAESRSKFDFFCLPSIVEPWGVVVHEFGLLGMPLLLSSEVGARCEFLIDSYNGYTFNPKDSESMKSILVKALKMSDVEIDRFGERSSVIAIKISRSIWSATLNAICSKIKSDS